MIDYSLYPTEATKAQQMRERRIGMGTMGLGTLSIMLGLRYGSDEHLDFIDDLYARIAFWAYDESMNLAAERGAFPAFDYEKYRQSGFVKRLLSKFPELDEKLRKNGIRNVTLLTQAPTGTTGTMIDNIEGMNVSTGIEPYYSWFYYRAGRLGVASQEVELVRQYREANGLAPDDVLPDYFVTAMELAPDDHVRVQATVQRWVDSAISKTANAPATFTVEDTAKLYELAYDLGCKGVTIYVDGSRQAQVLATTKEAAKIEAHIEADEMKSIPPMSDEDDAFFDEVARSMSEVDESSSNSFPKRGRRRFGFTDKLDVPIGDERLGTVYVTINVDDNGQPFEVFVNANDVEIADTAEALGRMVTQMIRFGGTSDNVEQAIKHLKRAQSQMFSLPSQIARLLNEVANKGVEFPSAHVETKTITSDDIRQAVADVRKSPKLAKCSSCGENAYDKANCVCHACGTSKCS
jgi:ribonucleoside-diphosphate reductase alpha chain